MAARTSAGSKATLSLGLVSVPIRLMVAAEDGRVQFNQLHAADGARVRQRKVCEGCGNEVSQDEIVRGFQTERDVYVTVTDEDIEALPVATKRILQIDATVDPEDIDPVMFNGKTYYVQPEDAATHAYGLVLGAFLMEGKAGLGRIAFRENREHLALLRAREDTLLLELMFWPDEVRALSAKDYSVGSGNKGEMGLARQLVDSLAVDFDPAAYRDTYREKLMERLEAKQAGVEPEIAEAAPKAGILDLQAALKASVESIEKGRKSVAKKPTTKRRRAS